MILFFSGTGNSEYVAKRIAKETGEEVINLGDRIREKNYDPISSDSRWIIVAPTYAWRLPRFVDDYLRRIELRGSRDVYFVLTCGGQIGNAGKYAKMLCDAKGLEYRGLAEVVMPENYIAMFSAPGEAEALAIIGKAEPVIDRIIERIKAGRTLEERVTVLDKFLSSAVNCGFYKLYVNDKAYRVSGECIDCGLCEKICPLGNISIENGKPKWNGNCTQCMACMNHCPVKAIDYGKVSVNKVKYVCPK